MPDPKRFVQTEPMIPLAPDEVFVPPTIEELARGETGKVVKEGSNG